MKRNVTRRMIAAAALATLVPAAGWADTATEGRPGPPAAAWAACEGKTAGDAVQFTTRRGDTVQATCREVDGRLVARPDSSRGGKWGKERGERHLARLTETLNLTAAQQEQVRTILASEREKASPLMEKVRDGRTALQAAIHSGTADEATIRSLAAAQAEHKADLLVARAEAWKQIHALLTPEQQELAKKAGPAAFAPGKGRHGKWRQGPAD